MVKIYRITYGCKIATSYRFSIGASLSESHTSRTALHTCLYAWTNHLPNFKWMDSIRWNIHGHVPAEWSWRGTEAKTTQIEDARRATFVSASCLTYIMADTWKQVVQSQPVQIVYMCMGMPKHETSGMLFAWPCPMIIKYVPSVVSLWYAPACLQPG